MWPKDHYDILAKNLEAFYPYPKNLPKAKTKSSGLISLAEGIWRQCDIEWLYADLQWKEQLGQKYKMYSLERKPRKKDRNIYLNKWVVIAF